MTATLESSIERRPRNCLGVDVEVTCDAELGRAMRELSWLESRVSWVQSATKAAIDAAKEQGEKKLVVTVEGTKLPIANRIQQLTAAVDEYCTAHRDDLLVGKKKTRSLSHGDISWKQPAATIADGGLMAKLDELSENSDGVRGVVVDAIAGIDVDCEHLTAADFLKVSVSLDKSTILAAYRKGMVTDEELAALGLSVTIPPERFVVKPFPYTSIESELE